MDGKNLHLKMALKKVMPAEAADVKQQGGPDVSGLVHEVTAKELRHALNQHGQADEATRHPGQRPLTIHDLKLIPAVINEPTEIKVQLHGKNKSSIVYSKIFDNSKIQYVERILETS
ncbi:MAG: hypothetical protein LBG74_04235, partial [Spirochaetaceae bacterium]|nr:hypothetical protein [Spirochaetaceae bacterium]